MMMDPGLSNVAVTLEANDLYQQLILRPHKYCQHNLKIKRMHLQHVRILLNPLKTLWKSILLYQSITFHRSNRPEISIKTFPNVFRQKNAPHCIFDED